MQKAVRNVGVFVNWMNGTRSLIQNDDPRFKAAATQAFGQEWDTLKPILLTQLDSSARIAQVQANRTIGTQGDLSAHAYVPADKVGAVFQSAMEEHLNDRLTSTVQAQGAGVQPPYGPPEKFDSGDAGWVVVVVARLREALGGKATFIHHSNLSNFRYDLPDQTTVALFADWATGELPRWPSKQP